METMEDLLLKGFITVHKALYRMSGGRIMGSTRGSPIILLTTTGRKSGKRRTIPLGYLPDGDGYALAASNGGRSYHPAWYRNLEANPAATMCLKKRQIPVRAEITSGEERARLWDAIKTTHPAFAKYEAKTSREIPVVVLREERA